MHRFSLLIAILWSTLSSSAQHTFQKISFAEALSRAKSEHKLVFLQFEFPDCTACNRVAATAFSDTALIKKLTSECISIRITATDSSWSALRKKYNTEVFPGTLFLDENGTLIHRMTSTTSLGARYISQIEQANRERELAPVYQMLESTYQDGSRDRQLLERLLAVRKKLFLDTDSLLEDYSSLFPAGVVPSEEVIKTIAYYAPMLESKADQLMRRNLELFNRAWYTIPIGQRIQINNTIVSKSKRKAIEAKDARAAFVVASFARSTNDKSEERQNAFETNMLDFFKAVKDTTAYLGLAASYYDRRYMTVSVDTIKKKDSLAMRHLGDDVKGDTVRNSDGSYTVRKIVSMGPPSQVHYSSTLNNAAFTVYLFSKDVAYLNKALEWVNRANEFSESDASLDTKARILYALKKRDEAILTQQKAIMLSKRSKIENPELEVILDKMMKGEVL